ncbi:ACP S-malonyltransferase [Paenibacillus lutrae]|uniref:[acyl-carrier-protein] S-malonyltransferase n=1 Tax=Paenibacillus lutrae TaxID=2078573 RepID=A0A7X3JY41_9BACL|nr:ACP S-malonyltransferase [Paenibacillus lutrae]MVO98612.1 ACP S-malonyltransferase [Paenibacillus lutrae]
MNKLAFIFPGQGSQYVGMGKDLVHNYPIAREVFEEASEALGFSLEKYCFDGTMEELSQTEITQPAILTVSVAAFKVITNETDLVPSLVAGHSLGEYSALVSAGVISLADAVRLVHKRGRFMQEAVEQNVGAMAAVYGMDKEIVREVCLSASKDGHEVVISSYNSPEQVVISGHRLAVEQAGASLTGMGAKVIPLRVSAPFHCALMASAGERMRKELEGQVFGSFTYPVISNVTGRPYDRSDEIVQNLTDQITLPVLWSESMKYAVEHGISSVIELGPQTVLRNLMKQNAPDIHACSFGESKDLKAVQEVIAKQQTAEPDKLLFIIRCLAIAVCTRNTNWDNEAYTKGVIEPYRKVQHMLEELESSGGQPTMEQMREALTMLQSVFTTKGTEKEEQQERFEQIQRETRTWELFPQLAEGILEAEPVVL